MTRPPQFALVKPPEPPRRRYLWIALLIAASIALAASTYFIAGG